MSFQRTKAERGKVWARLVYSGGDSLYGRALCHFDERSEEKSFPQSGGEEKISRFARNDKFDRNDKISDIFMIGLAWGPGQGNNSLCDARSNVVATPHDHCNGTVLRVRPSGFLTRHPRM